MTDREKLIQLIMSTPCVGYSSRTAVEHIADHLIANGVTVQQWIPVSEPPKVKDDGSIQA